MCQYLHSLQGGVQTMKSTFKNSQTLAAKFLNTGQYYIPMDTKHNVVFIIVIIIIILIK